MDFSEIFEWAEQHLKSRLVSRLRPHEYIYLLGGCWLRMRYIVGEPLTEALIARARNDMRQYLYSEYQKGTHSYENVDEMLDMLILPHMSFDVSGGRHNFFEIEDKVYSREL